MNPTQLFGVAPHPMYACYVSCVWVGLEVYVESKCFVSHFFDSVSEAHESKKGHLQTSHFIPLTTQAPVPQ